MSCVHVSSTSLPFAVSKWTFFGFCNVRYELKGKHSNWFHIQILIQFFGALLAGSSHHTVSFDRIRFEFTRRPTIHISALPHTKTNTRCTNRDDFIQFSWACMTLTNRMAEIEWKEIVFTQKCVIFRIEILNSVAAYRRNSPFQCIRNLTAKVLIWLYVKRSHKNIYGKKKIPKTLLTSCESTNARFSSIYSSTSETNATDQVWIVVC